MTKRVHYPINKTKIAESIELYMSWDGSDSEWNKIYYTLNDICPGSSCWATIHSLFQAMKFSNTLTIDNVYYAILASGVNTRLEEYDD